MASGACALRLSTAILCILVAALTVFPLCDARIDGQTSPKIRRTTASKPWKRLKSLNHLENYPPSIDIQTYDPYFIASQSSEPIPSYNSLAPYPTPSNPVSQYPPFSPHHVPPPPPTATFVSPPPKHAPSPPKINIPSPPTVYLPPVIYPPPPSSRPAHKKAPQYSVWCVAKPTVPDPIIQEAMDYACGSGADCKSIQPYGSCYQPNTLIAHASYAFNSYWQNTKIGGGTCDFGGTAMLVTVDPNPQRWVHGRIG